MVDTCAQGHCPTSSSSADWPASARAQFTSHRMLMSRCKISQRVSENKQIQQKSLFRINYYQTVNGRRQPPCCRTECHPSAAITHLTHTTAVVVTHHSSAHTPHSGQGQALHSRCRLRSHGHIKTCSHPRTDLSTAATARVYSDVFHIGTRLCFT